MKTLRATRLIFATLTLILLTINSRAGWQAGFASVKITPEIPVPLAGYAARTKNFEKVDQDIFGKALALADESGKKAVLITADVCILPADVVQDVTKRIIDKSQLSAERIILNCSHTHSGPQVSLKPSSSGSDETRDAIASYTRGLQDKLVQVAERALADLAPAELFFGKGLVNFPMNRREYTPTGVILGVNARGFADRSVPVLAIKSPEGKLRGLVMVCACHGTTVPSDHLGLNGDYPGYAQHLIEAKHPAAQAMFMMGCGGDANPFPRKEPGLAERHGEELAGEVLRLLETPLRPMTGNLICASELAALPLEQVSREELEKRATSRNSVLAGTAKQLIATLDRGENPLREYKAPITVWQFGTNLTWVALPGEVVSDYVLRLEEALGPLDLVVCGYSNDVFGYLPSARTLREGGYETRGLFSGAGWFAPEVEQVVLRTTKSLAEKVGRKISPSNQ